VVLDRIAASTKTYVLKGATSFQSGYDNAVRRRFVDFLAQYQELELHFVFPDLKRYRPETKVAKNSFAEFKKYVFDHKDGAFAQRVKGWAITDFDQAFRLGLSANCVNHVLVEYGDHARRSDVHGPKDGRAYDVFLEVNFDNGRIEILEVGGVARESMYKGIRKVLRELKSEFLVTREETEEFCDALPATLPEYQYPETI
jgi:hypothetical protein